MDDEKLLDLFTDAVRMHSAYVKRNLKRMHLQIGQGAVIMTLGDYGEMPQNQIARLRKVSAATISVMIRRMEKSGLVVRKNDESDAKVHIIALTSQGREAYQMLKEDSSRRPDIIFGGLTDEEKKEAEHLFRTICSNLEENKITEEENKIAEEEKKAAEEENKIAEEEKKATKEEKKAVDEENKTMEEDTVEEEDKAAM